MSFQDFCKLLHEKGYYSVHEDYDDDENLKFYEETFYCLHQGDPIQMVQRTCNKGSLSKNGIIRTAATQFLVKRGLDSL